MKITSYDITYHFDGQDSNGKGRIGLDRENGTTSHMLSWQSGGRDCIFTLDGQDIARDDSLHDFLSNWTEPWDAVESYLDKTENHDCFDQHSARVSHGQILWLIVNSKVLIGTIRPETFIESNRKS